METTIVEQQKKRTLGLWLVFPESTDQFEVNWHLTNIESPHEHSIPLYLFRLSLISLSNVFYFPVYGSWTYFFYYILLVMLLQLSWFFPLCPPPPSTHHSLRQSLHHCSCPWVKHRFFDSSVSCTVLYIPWLFCDYLFVLLNPLTFSPIPPHLPSHLATIKTLSVSMILSLFFLFA